MFNFSMPELILILVIALVVFGPGKLPEVGKALGRSLQEFKNATSDANKNASVKSDITAASDIKKEDIKPEEKK